VVNNVETFAAAARIAVQGPEWFRSAGTEQSTGTKLLSVSGDCARPGVYEFPLGVALDEVLAASGAGEARAVQVSGPAGVLVGADEFGRRIAYEDLPTGGAIMVFGPNRDLLEILANHTRFFAHESCGFCTPCRVGTALQRDLVARIRDRGANRGDVEQLEAVAGLMKMASHCGLGQTAPNSVLDTLRRFPELYQERVASR
jgi:[NiFe] hydrogenase diaphorase moiety large subunit